MPRRNTFDDASLESLRKLYLSKRKIPEHQLLKAIDSDNPLAHALAHEIVTDAYRRIHPEPEMLRIAEFLLDYYLGCMERESPYMLVTTDESMTNRILSSVDTAMGLLTWIEVVWRQRPETDALIGQFVERITDLFLRSDDDTRQSIEIFLQTALERIEIQPLFAHWKDHPQLSEAHFNAMQWAAEFERPIE